MWYFSHAPAIPQLYPQGYSWGIAGAWLRYLWGMRCKFSLTTDHRPWKISVRFDLYPDLYSFPTVQKQAMASAGSGTGLQLEQEIKVDGIHFSNQLVSKAEKRLTLRRNKRQSGGVVLTRWKEIKIVKSGPTLPERTNPAL